MNERWESLLQWDLNKLLFVSFLKPRERWAINGEWGRKSRNAEMLRSLASFRSLYSDNCSFMMSHVASRLVQHSTIERFICGRLSEEIIHTSDKLQSLAFFRGGGGRYNWNDSCARHAWPPARVRSSLNDHLTCCHLDWLFYNLPALRQPDRRQLKSWTTRP